MRSKFRVVLVAGLLAATPLVGAACTPSPPADGDVVGQAIYQWQVDFNAWLVGLICPNGFGECLGLSGWGLVPGG